MHSLAGSLISFRTAAVLIASTAFLFAVACRLVVSIYSRPSIATAWTDWLSSYLSFCARNSFPSCCATSSTLWKPYDQKNFSASSCSYWESKCFRQTRLTSFVAPVDILNRSSKATLCQLSGTSQTSRSQLSDLLSVSFLISLSN